MTSMPFVSLLIQGYPEAIVTCALAFALLNVRLNWARIIPLGIAFGTVAYLTRFLPLTPLEPTLIGLVSTTLLIQVTTGNRLIWVLLAVLCSTTFLMLIQIPLSQYALSLFHTTFNAAYEGQPVIWSLANLPHVIIGLIAALAVDFFRRRVIKTGGAVPVGHPQATPGFPGSQTLNQIAGFQAVKKAGGKYET